MKAFREAIKLAVKYKENSTDFMDEVLRELEVHFECLNQFISTIFVKEIEVYKGVIFVCAILF